MTHGVHGLKSGARETVRDNSVFSSEVAGNTKVKMCRVESLEGDKLKRNAAYRQYK